MNFSTTTATNSTTTTTTTTTMMMMMMMMLMNRMIRFGSLLFVLLLLSLLESSLYNNNNVIVVVEGFTTQTQNNKNNNLNKNNNNNNNNNNHRNNINIDAAVLVPGFLTGAEEFRPLCETLTKRGLPTIAVPMPNWHWLPCLGGRSARPILERIDYTVQHLIANDGNISKPIPPYEYTLKDAWMDFRQNPGGILQVGGSSKVDEYPIYHPAGQFPKPDLLNNTNTTSNKRIALIGHSAGGWISRVYLSPREYGGKVYNGTKYIHSLVTLGTPHAAAQGPAFEGVSWINEELVPVRALSVAGSGYKGTEWGELTSNSYSFCCPEGSNGTMYDGDGLTPVFSSLGMEGAEHMVLDGVGHFCWSDVFGGKILAPELSKGYNSGRPWYGSEEIVDQWATWILDHCSSTTNDKSSSNNN